MPISTNAPFNEFGQSQILRDIEQLYLALNGAGSGGPGDGQTQDQTAVTAQDSGGLPDLSGLATIAYVDAAIAAIPPATGVQSGYLYGNGSISLGGAPFSTIDASYSTTSGSMAASLSGKTFTAPFSGIFTVCSRLYVGFDRAGSPAANYQFLTTITAPYGSISDVRAFPQLVFTATGISWTQAASALTPFATWTGYIAQGGTVTFTHNGNGTAAADISGGSVSNWLTISGVG
jgi:hypothetical protein